MGCTTPSRCTVVLVVVVCFCWGIMLAAARTVTQQGVMRRTLQQSDAGLRCRLYCQTGFFLQVNADGVVNGTKDPDSKYGVLEMLRVTIKLVSVRGVMAGTYLCMNRRGKTYASEKRTSECVFTEEYLETSYYVYSSKKYSRRRKKLYIGINRRGRSKRARRPNQRCTQFYVRAVDDSEWTDLVANQDDDYDDDSAQEIADE